jgi:hypothetical protein
LLDVERDIIDRHGLPVALVQMLHLDHGWHAPAFPAPCW